MLETLLEFFRSWDLVLVSNPGKSWSRILVSNPGLESLNPILLMYPLITVISSPPISLLFL
uniref:Uncharacterized protein n=1 Tax=Meloidogyne enterolobii TaxID=390850 RepID=A0A6V7U1L6_MELEN|nr:unnamed protein product [Meloidogyne enterolobii]